MDSRKRVSCSAAKVLSIDSGSPLSWWSGSSVCAKETFRGSGIGKEGCPEGVGGTAGTGGQGMGEDWVGAAGVGAVVGSEWEGRRTRMLES